ncbi:GNAT family N-acetyltransferase [Antribacter gilvus]|uniref:GNAT family N-acetyltransferase n=1 Tax=Antribacter gilvus TaxID=2304675 RepID=UPI000F76CCEF|nr:GNAT family protein [Antribacter gilvus]
MEPFVLANETVRLSVPTLADVDDVWKACQDPQIEAWNTVPTPYARQDAVAFLEGVVAPGWSAERSFTWAVRAPGECDGPVLGMVGLDVEDATPGVRSAGLGFWMAPAARGHGLVTAACHLALDWGFDPEGLELSRATWLAYVGNWPSRRVAWKLGFRVEGTIRGQGVQRGRRRDAWFGTLLPGDPREPNEAWPAEAPASAEAVLPRT